ncbi:ABC-type multidrug transport system, ATPase and permease component [Mucilaginibacter gossypiicola]|uniref:ABC-type multidrug transport system, ATPase and permease component n=1 Tax=Mucilaginibacter gossypiicola TaxID=551995 RepID=A0A1H8GA55_9SPHI|nr:ABC transporter ATP-binding protein [Mucilaginibacter gossypiicola]SEN40640.1 ABC-type multidrug transport system, ATPase and permease component [Mucilaginibacter gossypiicola]
MKQILKSILLILNQSEKRRLIGLIIADIVIALLDVTFLAMLLLIVNFYTQQGVRNNYDFLPAGLVNDKSLLPIAIFLVLFAIKNCIGFFAQNAQHHFFYQVASRLSERNIRNYLDADFDQFIQVDSSIHTRRISQQPIEFSHYILTNFQQIISQIVLILFTIGAIMLYHPALFVLLFVLLLPPVAALGWFIKSKLKSIRGQIKTMSEKTLQHLNESLSGYVESNIYQKNDFFSHRFFSYQQQLNQNIALQQTWQNLPSRLMEVFAVLGFFILIAVNKLIGETSVVSILAIGIFVAAAYKIIPGIVKILNSGGQMKTYEFILADLIIEQSGRLQINEIIDDRITSLKFEGVSFSYPDKSVLDELYFKMLSGDIVGVSGNSGRGKTTIINLIVGFLEPASGGIFINGKNADAVMRRLYRKNISLVKQQPFFIYDTIRKNIILDDVAADEQKLAEVLAFCGLNKLIAGYPEGAGKIVTENGKNISGGQRQRIMLARALYHDHDLLILDEPFSEVDADAENELLTKLQQLALQGKMIMLITHNKASLAICNKIISPNG